MRSTAMSSQMSPQEYANYIARQTAQASAVAPPRSSGNTAGASDKSSGLPKHADKARAVVPVRDVLPPVRKLIMSGSGTNEEGADPPTGSIPLMRGL